MHKKETKRATPPRRGKLDAEQLEYTYGLLDQGVRGRKEIIQRIKNKFGFEVGEHVIQLAQARYDERKLVQAEQANGGNGNGHEPQADRKKPPTQSGKHLREMYDQRRAEGKSKVRELRIAIAKAAKEVEYFPMPESLEWDEEVQFMVEELYSDLERLRDWTDDALQVVMSHMDDISLQRKYRQAVELSNSGKTAGERMAGANAAERLRKRMNAERLNAPRQEN